ncbi:MAG: DUF2520 domain-containing protein [Ilumatobacteraceae bacterium]
MERAMVAVVGRGRMGNALVRALPQFEGPFGRGFDGRGDDTGNGRTTFDIVLLAVPDGEIAAAAAVIVSGALVGHCSGASTLAVLGDRESFSVHPLMTVTAEGAPFAGASAAVAGSTPHAFTVARDIADALGLRPVEIADIDRAAYHAAASIAANFLITLEDAAESLIRSAGGDRMMLLPLVQAAVDNWARLGGPDALTGPIARGDETTVDHQRSAVAERTPQLLDMFDSMAEATRSLSLRR